MNLSLLVPLGLAALAAMALPLLIHLVRRIELTTTEFAALRWISERVRPRRRIRFERPWLLLLRLLLLALLALLLARPVLSEFAGVANAWLAVAPGVDRARARAAVDAPDAQWHWLSEGFPLLQDESAGGAAPLASLLRELDARLPAATALTVIVPEELAGLDGERLRLARTIDWRIVPGRMPITTPAAADAPILLSVRYAAGQAASLTYLRAAVAAWNTREPQRYRIDAQPLSEPPAEDARWLIVLSPELPAALRAWIERGGVAILAQQSSSDGDALWHDAGGNVLARSAPMGHGRRIALTGTLTPTDLPDLLDAAFPQRLLDALRGPAAAPTRAHATTVKPRTGGTVASAAALSSASVRPLDPWLALLIALLFLLERLVALWPRRGEPA